MNDIRIKFTRGDKVKFISHLDLMKVFERALRRSGVPIAYSQGFNPHPQLIFGLPLSVGVTSEAEYADFELAEDMKPFEFMEKMNAALPMDIRIVDAGEKHFKGNIMATIAAAVYDVSIFLTESRTLDEIDGIISGFLQKDTIIVKKEGKNGIKDINIRTVIHKLEAAAMKQVPPGYEQFEAAFCLTAFLAAGSISNLKPELLITALVDEAGLGIGSVRIHRKGLYVNKEGRMADPMEDAVLMES